MFQCLFQSFDDTATPAQGAPRLQLLRTEMARLGFDGFVIPRADDHQNEYVPAGAERLAWLTGFTGSAGLAIVLANQAAIFVDGRYTLQVRDQVDLSLLTPVALADMTPEVWIGQTLKAAQVLGYDAWLHTPAQVARLQKAADSVGAVLKPVPHNLIDAVWKDRPAEPCGAITLHPEKLAGDSAASKLQRIAASLKAGTNLLVSDPHAVAWAFNIRGQDVAHTPLPMSYAAIPHTGRPSLFVNPAKLTPDVAAALGQLADVHAYTDVVSALQVAGAAKHKYLFDQTTVAAALVQAFEAAGGVADVATCPIQLMKACKTQAELAGARAAHIRDGVAMVRFLRWFANTAPQGGLDEIQAAQALETFRRETGVLKDISFPTISATGPNSAIPHYRVTRTTNRPITEGLFLIDSGAQYEDGTTDITRTLCVGVPTPQMKDRTTRVLKGHIAIATARFPKGTSGAQLDALARRPLWDVGLDFDHGTGHGVGSYLSVHEGPQRISKVSSVALQPGMILSNEPGFYAAGQWGIRLENLVVVTSLDIAGADRPFLGFETITLAPFETALVDKALLNGDEIAWLNAYHARVRETLAPLVPDDDRAWLIKATQAI